MTRRIAYSYGRFSSSVQDQGDSTRRQDAGALSWCERNHAALDDATRYMDSGTSAFRGKQRRAGAPLRAFLDEVEAGRVPRGSVLIIENLDRLSRENPWDAVPLLCQIVNGGVDVVTLSPSETVYTRSGDLTGLILAVVEFGRGHSESKSKSDRLAELWTEKKRKAREDGSVITRRLPAWVAERDGRLAPVPARVKVVRRLFEMAAGGCGLFEIVKTLTREKIKSWGRGGSWNKAYVHKILSGRAVLGEHQPRKDGKPDGAAIVGYYPQVIEPEQWEQAQAVLAGRKDHAGRIGKKVTNLFTGLLTDAATGERMLIAWQTRGSGKKRCKVRVLVPAGSMEGRGRSVSFPYPIFESCILQCFAEVKAEDVFGEQPASDSAKLIAQRDSLERRLKALEAELASDDGEDIPALARAARVLDAKLQDVLKRLAVEQQKEACPASATLAETQTLLAAAEDPARRLRLRGLLARLIESVHVLIVPVPGTVVRLCAAQASFRDGGRRDWLIRYSAAGRNRPEHVDEPRSITADVAGDLRDRADAAKLAEHLTALELDA